MNEILKLLKRIMQMPENAGAAYFSSALLPAVIKNLVMSDRREIPVRQLNVLIAAADFCEVPSVITKRKLKDAVIFYEIYRNKKQSA